MSQLPFYPIGLLPLLLLLGFGATAQSPTTAETPIECFAQPPTPIDETEVFIHVTGTMPRFPGCEDLEGSASDKKNCADQKLLKFIYTNFVPPIDAAGEVVEGMAVVSFTVTKTGAIADLQLLRDPGGGVGAEALRVVALLQDLPPWTPATQRGVPVDARFNLPIRSRGAD